MPRGKFSGVVRGWHWGVSLLREIVFPSRDHKKARKDTKKEEEDKLKMTDARYWERKRYERPVPVAGAMNRLVPLKLVSPVLTVAQAGELKGRCCKL